MGLPAGESTCLARSLFDILGVYLLGISTRSEKWFGGPVFGKEVPKLQAGTFAGSQPVHQVQSSSWLLEGTVIWDSVVLGHCYPDGSAG